MTTRVLIDTGALLAIANPRDQYHGRAVDRSRGFLATGGRWVGTALVLGELHGHLLHRRGPGLARMVVAQLMADPAFEWRDVPLGLIQAAIDAWLVRYGDQPFSLTDAVSFELMRREKLTTAFAFDQDFVTAGYELLR